MLLSAGSENETSNVQRKITKKKRDMFVTRAQAMTMLTCYFDPKCIVQFNPLSMKLCLSDLKTHFAPLSKHSLLRF